MEGYGLNTYSGKEKFISSLTTSLTFRHSNLPEKKNKIKISSLFTGQCFPSFPISSLYAQISKEISMSFYFALWQKHTGKKIKINRILFLLSSNFTSVI